METHRRLKAADKIRLIAIGEAFSDLEQ
ncbi:protein of unknown function [Methylocaldum szegediense]|uniref:Uncharacterized protein n=1 Tax=Methylocaldum szegediense TaxID=73780 RepID=A0ABM9HYN3_9GAMM|nr:protein of unknown function [Methylocaldum szegediense]